jgi:hypothetical protein
MWYRNFSKDGETIRLLKFLYHIPDDFSTFTEVSISHTWWLLHLYWSFYITYLMVSPPLLKFLYHIPDGFSIFTEVSISHTWWFLHLYWSFYITYLMVHQPIWRWHICTCIINKPNGLYCLLCLILSVWIKDHMYNDLCHLFVK